ncbi:MAG TPA: glycosyltransferase [Actinophytocola sp.]|uniref:glycosyltransferase family 8 protein n=1 Tax=Actinophytocola sp. TaxID=1872138 RepID=UPI002DFE736F|nr:glycosyltransferase [Actinophytocola sp.]
MFAIALCIDESYLVPAMATLASLADCLPPDERRGAAVRLLTQDLSRPHVSTMAAFVRRLGFTSFDVEWRKAPHGVDIVEGASYITTTTYLRFQLTPRFVDRPYLLYLDADVLVLSDISAPFAGLDDGRVGAVRDEFNFAVGECPALPGLVERWPTLRGRPYFNAGALWLRSHVMPVVRAGVAEVITRRRRYIHFNDQDALNMWLLATSRAAAVDARLNRFELDRFLEKGDWVRRVVRRDPRSSDVGLLHFVGPMKPWQNSCPRTAGVRLYSAYLRDAIRLLHRLGGRNIGLSRDGGEPA